MKKSPALILPLCLALLIAPLPAFSAPQADIDPTQEARFAYEAGDYPKASLLFGLLAKRGNAIAQYNLGVMYEQGQYLPKNLRESVQWYLLAAEQGYAPAQFNLGNIYSAGEAMPQDFTRATSFYRAAAEQGYAPAQVMLGSMYAKGEHVFQDPRQALHWYRLAAAQGNAVAQSYLGEAYDNGTGVAQDPTRAYMWLKLAAANAKTAAMQTQYTERLAATAKKLNEAQIAQAHKLGVNCAGSAYKDCSDQYSPTDQYIALQHEQQTEHQQEQPGETQQLPAEPKIAAVASEEVHPAAKHQQQDNQEEKQSQDQHGPAVAESGSL